MSRDIPNYEGFFKDLPTYSDVGSRVDDSVINISRDRFNVQSESTPKDETSTPKQPQQMIYTPKIRYDEGIRTVRLFQNKIGEIVNDDEQIMEEEEQEYEGNQYIGVNQNLLYDDNEENKQQDQDIFQSRSHLDKLIDQNVVPFSIKFLTFVEVFFTLSMIALAFTDYFLDVNQIADIQLNLEVYNQQTDVMAELQYVNGYIRDLQLLQTGIGTDSSTTLKESMLNSLNSIQEKLDYVVLSGYQMPKSMRDLYSIPSIIMQFENNNSTQNFQEATSQMLAYGRYIVTMTDETITLFSNDVAIYFFLQNGFNNYCKSLSDTAQYVLDDFITRSADRSQNFVILVVIAAVVLSISFAMIVIILLSTRLSKEYIVILFLELPNRVIRNLFNKCEQFARFLNQIEGEGSEKEDDFDHNTDSDEPLMVLDSKKKKKKKFKNSTKPPYSFYIQIFILACFMEAYFIVSLFMQKSNLDQIRQTIYESSAAIAGEQLYALSNNAQQGEFIDPDQIILDETVQQNTLSNLYKMYQQDSLIHKEHSKNIYNLEQVYIDAFNTIMFQNPCNTLNQINSDISVTECETFADGSIKSGFAVALTRFVEKIRYLQTLFYQTTQDSSITLEQFGLTEHQVYDDALRNLQINLLQLPSIKEIKDMQLIYFRTGIRYLGNQFIEGILTRENSYKSVKLGLFIVYLILIILLYFFYWVPFHRHLMQDIWKTRMTLLMIPVDNLRRLKNAKAYVKGLVNKSM